MVNYNETIIYKLCCKNSEITDVYIGHTTNFRKRKNDHKESCNNQNSMKYNLKVYKFIRDNGGFENWNMVMIEEYQCENKLQAMCRERHWIENLNSTLNCIIPTRSKEEYCDVNKEKINEYQKKYREENTEEINKKRNEKVECECSCKISLRNISTHKKSNKHLELMKLKTETK